MQHYTPNEELFSVRFDPDDMFIAAGSRNNIVITTLIFASKKINKNK